jgi:hypothetical protein
MVSATAAAAAAPPAPVLLLLSLAQESNDIIKDATSDGMKLSTKATNPQKTAYDRSSEGLRLLLESFKDHATKSSWTLNITVPTSDGIRNLAARYGQITDAELQTRLMQNSSQIITYLKGLLDDIFKLEVYMNAALYTLAGVESGELFLMEIIKLVNADTCATVGYLQESLSLLPLMVVKLNNVIKALDKYINNQVDALT